MKKSIHPQYYTDTTITCACGAVLKTGSTKEDNTVEICSQCHPFYTGKKKVLDTTGRVDRFKKLAQRASQKKANAQAQKASKAKKTEKKETQKEEK